MEELTSIGLSKKTKDRLELIKVHPNQSYEEVINFLLDKFTTKK